MAAQLHAPWPYFGGKRSIAHRVWELFGDVDHYIEPFAGGAAVLLGRPRGHAGDVETLNDADGLVTNAWRAIRYAPGPLAVRIRALPISELDLHARNLALRGRREGLVTSLRQDPYFFDLEAAAWWVHGQCAWTGGGWCRLDSPRRPKLSRPGLGAGSRSGRASLPDDLANLAARLQDVRICCGDWGRVVTPDALSCGGKDASIGIFLDPPYSHDMRDAQIYGVEMSDAGEVAAWAHRTCVRDPRVRVVLCGLWGEHDMPGWTQEVWRDDGETLWCSPSCFAPTQVGLWS